MTNSLVLSENETLELLAFLVTAARILVDEPVEVGPLRLLMAAGRLCASAQPRCTEEVGQLMQGLMDEIPPYLVRRNSKPDEYVAFMDRSCRAIARVLMRRAGVLEG